MSVSATEVPNTLMGQVSFERSGSCVAHLDADAFYVSTELNPQPDLPALPVVVSDS